MRRNRLLLAAVVVCIITGLVVLPHFLTAQPGTSKTVKQGEPGAGSLPAGLPKSNAALLPIKKVIMFTSGVAYFQREGQVEGDTRIDLSFPVQDINDLLKSMVLRDLNGGKISTVGYDSHDPIDKTLKSFAINLSGNPTFFSILNQARGEKVTVTWHPVGHVNPTLVVGTIIDVEKKKQPVNKDAVADVEFLSIWTKDGLRSLNLAEVVQVQFQNSALASEMERALEVVSQGHDTQKKTVSLFFKGKGKRTVQVGYVVEHPIWKTSYRMVMSEKGNPLLQGWAMVENPTNEDWNDVILSLVSGQPVSFKMDLYEPLYVNRPVVKLKLFDNLKPPVYEGEMDYAGKDKGKADAKYPAEKKESAFGGAPASPPPPSAGFGPGSGFYQGMKETTQAVAQAVKVGDQFQYVIGHPVSLPRQKSALVPIVSTEVEGTAVSIFNQNSLPKYPMLGLKFKNTTKLHLMQGPITVFAEDSYAGDALIENIQPGEERLLSFAVDQAMEVKTESKQVPDPLVKMVITKGIVHKTITLRDTKTYTVKNRSEKDKVVILEHPIRTPDYTLVKPAKEPPKSQSFYRFEMAVPADATKDFVVVEEKQILEEIYLTNMNDQTLALIIKTPGASPALKAALQQAIDLKLKVAKSQTELAQVNNKIQVIAEDQARQRDNMKVIPQTDPVYKKYLEKFLKQEEQLEQLHAQAEKLQTTINQQQQAYEDYVLNLSIKEEEKKPQ